MLISGSQTMKRSVRVTVPLFNLKKICGKYCHLSDAPYNFDLRLLSIFFNEIKV